MPKIKVVSQGKVIVQWNRSINDRFTKTRGARINYRETY